MTLMETMFEKQKIYGFCILFLADVLMNDLCIYQNYSDT